MSISCNHILLTISQIPISLALDHTMAIPWPRRPGLSITMTRLKRTSFQMPSNGPARHIKKSSQNSTASVLVGTVKQSGSPILRPSPGSSKKPTTPWIASSTACTILQLNCATRRRRHTSPPTIPSKITPTQSSLKSGPWSWSEITRKHASEPARRAETRPPETGTWRTITGAIR